MNSVIQLADKSLDLSRTQIMGVLNVTPDSFSDGGNYTSLEAAVRQAELMTAQGASIIDIGGESTRPGADPVTVQEEMERVLPVLEALKGSVDAVYSIDTSTPELMREALALGANIINDVRAFSRPGALDAVKHSDAGLCVMHMQGVPKHMQDKPEYDSVFQTVRDYLLERVQLLEQSGVASQRIILDPGFGFGKTLEHNLELLDKVDELEAEGYPVLVGVSRKTMIGDILGKPVDQRLFGSISAAAIAAYKGAAILRVHDVAETVDAIKVVNALKFLE